MEIGMEMPQKLKIELPNDPVIPLLGVYLEASKSPYCRDTGILMFIDKS
jgi:hypothetical protein